MQQLEWSLLEERRLRPEPLCCTELFIVKLRYQHRSISLQMCRAQEDITADTAFQLGLLIPSDTASFLRQFRYGITCHLLSSCLLPSRCSSPDWQVSCWHGGQIRSILFFIRTFCTFLSVLFLEFYNCFCHFMHICCVRHYTQEEEEEEEGFGITLGIRLGKV